MTREQQRCPHCGQSIAPGNRFCEWCGKPATQQSAPQIPQRREGPAAPPPPPAAQPASGPPPSATARPPILLIALIAGGALLVCLLIAGGGAFLLSRGADPDPTSPAAFAPTRGAPATEPAVPTAASESVEPAPVEPAEPPATVVEAFVKATLGTVPDADIDYDYARSLMTGSYAAQFDSPAFVPTTYGIQDGPTSYGIASEESADVTATVEVIGEWGGEPGRRWVFVLNQEGGSWKIASINTLPVSGLEDEGGTASTSMEPLLGEWQTDEGEGSDVSDRFRVSLEPDGRLRVRWVDEYSDIEGIEDLEQYYLELQPDGPGRWVGDAITVTWDPDTGEAIEDGREPVVLILSDGDQQLLIGPPDSEGIIARRVAGP